MKKHLGEEQKRYCRQGHANESKFLKQFHKHSEQGLTCGYRSVAVYESPLVVSKDHNYFLDSADAELVYRKDSERDDDDDDDNDDDAGTHHSCPVEIKSRLAHSTFYDERDRLLANEGRDAWENAQPVYTELDAESEEFRKWLPKSTEQFQLLHHVAIRKQRKGLILVGDKDEIMFGVFVNYNQETIDAYTTVLREIYDRALSLFYETDPIEIPREKIEQIIKCKEMKHVGLTYHSFLTDLYLWRKLRIDEVLRLPLPPCNRVLPYIHSYWNNNKGGSDTTSKLLANCPALFASFGRPQTITSARLWLLFAVLLHRLNHAARANENIDHYGSLYHLRNTNNQKWPLWTTLDRLEAWLKNEADTYEAMMDHGGDFRTALASSNNENRPPRTPNRVVRFDATTTTPQPRRGRDNPRNALQERVATNQTGATPKRGRPAYPVGPLTQAQREFRERAHACDGSQYYRVHVPKGEKRDKYKKACYLCRKLTVWTCMGCHRPCCEINQDEVLRKLITDDAKSVAFLNGVKPPATFVYESTNADGTKVVVSTVENSCFHILHRHGHR